MFRVPPQDASYTLVARKGGYAEGGSGRMRIGGALQPVTLNALTPSANVMIRVWKLGAITGTVIDEAGEAVVGVQVRALERTAGGGARAFAPAGAMVTTDDRGVYRISSLPPGEYIVLDVAAAAVSEVDHVCRYRANRPCERRAGVSLRRDNDPVSRSG